MEAHAISPLHDPLAMREVLQRSLGLDRDSPLQVRDVRIANTRRRDGTRGTVEYELSLYDSASGHAREQRVTGVNFGGDRTRRVWESICQTRSGGSDTIAATPLPPFAYVPELDLLLQVFPHDFRLPALAALMAGPPPDLVPALLAECGPGQWELTHWRAEPVQYRVDMRAILQISVRARNAVGVVAGRQYYAKIYRDGSDCQRAAETQRAVAAQTAERGLTLSAAREVALLGKRHTLVTEALPGTSLSRIVRRGEGVLPAVRAAARAAAEFHQLDVAATPRPAATEIAQLHESAALLAAERPDLTDQIADIVIAVTAGLTDAPVGLIHGDLKPEHMLLDGDRVSMIDFDLIAAADPVADVAHLVTFLGKPLERARHRRDDRLDVAGAFVDEYFAHAPPSGRSRLPLYHAITAIHKAVGLSRRRGAEGQARIDDVLLEARALLDNRADDTIPTFKRRMTRNAARGR